MLDFLIAIFLIFFLIFLFISLIIFFVWVFNRPSGRRENHPLANEHDQCAEEYGKEEIIHHKNGKNKTNCAHNNEFSIPF